MELTFEQIKLQKAFDAGWDGAIKWYRSKYPDNLGRKIYVEELERLLDQNRRYQEDNPRPNA